jgi:lipoprotein-anchoring transpeptidase ErfK/SrfK
MIAGGVGLLVVVVWLVIPKSSNDMATVTQVEADSPARNQSSADVKALYQQAVAKKDAGELAEAKEIYRTILTDHPNFENIASVQKELEEVNLRILFSNIETSKTVLHEVVSGDTLGELAKKYGTTIDLIKRSNNLSSNVIRVGQRLRIWTGKFNIFVDKSQNKLTLKDGDEIVKVYDVSTGTNNSTPVGTYTITSKLIDPVWFNKGIVLPPESPDNVLGSRWLGFDLPGYGIHGTIEPDAIGQQVTAGCVRMRNAEVEELYSIVPMGTEVTIVN